MFIYKRRVFLKDTDATGVIYFTAIFQYALEAMEVFLEEKARKLPDLLAKGYLLPIVHASGDLKAPLKVGDELVVELSVKKIGTTSFSLQTQIWKMPDRLFAGNTEIIHVFVRKGEEFSSPIPSEIYAFLKDIN